MHRAHPTAQHMNGSKNVYEHTRHQRPESMETYGAVCSLISAFMSLNSLVSTAEKIRDIFDNQIQD
jgi:hypothetical protein